MSDFCQLNPIPFMKKFLLLITTIITLYSCNSSSETVAPTVDSLNELINSIRDSIKLHPADTLAKYKLVLILQDVGRYKEAVSVLDSMNISNTDSANTKTYYNYLFKRSELLMLAGDTANAIKTLELFVIPGELTEAGLRLADLYAETKNPKTISLCDAMNKNDASGHDPNPDYLKGVYYYNTEELEKALAQFNSCILKDYTFMDAYMEKGRILYKQKKYQEAITVYDLALSISNSYADAFFWKAKCQEALGQTKDAKLNYQKAYGLDKTLTEAKEAADKLK